MNTFLDDMFKGSENEDFEKLDAWSRGFWIVDKDNIKVKFAQQGYEDKGYGHIQRIIANVGELFEGYFGKLYDLQGTNLTGRKRKFFEKMKNEVFRGNLLLFCVTALLHDIGMNFPRIFKALSRYVKERGQYPHHIGEIIYEYHHYASFIILMEMSCIKVGVSQFKNCPYLKNISDEKNKEDIMALNGLLETIHKDHFGKFFDSIKEFKIVLAILCLLLKKVKNEYVESIVRKFVNKNKDVVKIFEKWWDYFERAKKWTEKAHQRYLRNRDELSTSNEAKFLKANDGSLLDLQLVEALLQYGDKTEITIARLARKQNGYNKMPLEDFIEDTEFDERKGYICTNMAQKVISDFARARACCYISVLLITVEKNANKKTPELDIVIHYLRFDNDKDVFKYIRYQDEKDFYDLGFLRDIRLRIPKLISYSKELMKRNYPSLLNGSVYKSIIKNPVFELKFKREEHSVRNVLMKLKTAGISVNNFPETKEGLKKIKECKGNFPYTQQNCDAINKYANLLIKPEGKKRVFYKSCDKEVPANFEIMAVLNLFDKEG
ncbi:MAG: hypothetical protein NT166_26820 [Candidatus Aminicenantes bacterium]|nr:hypothetical protein [Candidatus Aminicenantes bacterium]